MPEPNRRRSLLAGVGTLGFSALAGCTSLLDDDDDEEDVGDEDAPEYTVEFSLSELHLDDLENSDLPSYTREDIAEEYSVWFSITIHEDDTETDLELEDLDDWYITLEDDREYTDTELPEYEFRDGEEITFHAEYEGQEFSDEDEASKRLPETIEAVPYWNGEPLYEQYPQHYLERDVEFRFARIEFDEELYHELRQQDVYNNQWDEIIEPTVEQDEVEFNSSHSPSRVGGYSNHDEDRWITDYFSQHGPENIEDILRDTAAAFLLHYNEVEGGAPSGQMNNYAATTQTLIDLHIHDVPHYIKEREHQLDLLRLEENRYQYEQTVKIEGFMTLTTGSANHGNALFQIKNEEYPGNWLNFDPASSADTGINPPSEARDAGIEDRYYPPTDYQKGEVEPITYSTKKSMSTRTAVGPFKLARKSDRSDSVTRSDIDVDGFWLEHDMSCMAEDNPYPDHREKALKSLTYASATTDSYEYVINFGGDEEMNRFILTNNGGGVYNRFRERSDPVSTAEAERRILN